MPRRRRWRSTVQAGLSNPTPQSEPTPIASAAAAALPDHPDLRADLIRLSLILTLITTLLIGATWIQANTDLLTNLGQSLYTFLGF